MASPQLPEVHIKGQPPRDKHRITVFPTEPLMNAHLDSLKEHKRRVMAYYCKDDAAITLRESD